MAWGHDFKSFPNKTSTGSWDSLRSLTVTQFQIVLSLWDLERRSHHSLNDQESMRDNSQVLHQSYFGPSISPSLGPFPIHLHTSFVDSSLGSERDRFIDRTIRAGSGSALGGVTATAAGYHQPLVYPAPYDYSCCNKTISDLQILSWGPS